MGGVVRRYIDILIIIITFPYSTCIRLYWLTLPCIVLIRPSQLSSLSTYVHVAQLVEHLPHKQYVMGSNPT